MFILTQLRQCRSALRWHHKSSGYSRPRFSQSTSSHSQRAWCCLQRSRGWGRCAATSDGRSAYRRQNSPQRNVNFPLENIFTNPAVGAEGFVFGAEAKPGSGLPLPIKPPLVQVCPVLVVIWWSAILRGLVLKGLYGSCMRCAVCRIRLFRGILVCSRGLGGSHKASWFSEWSWQKQRWETWTN